MDGYDRGLVLKLAERCLKSRFKRDNPANTNKAEYRLQQYERE